MTIVTSKNCAHASCNCKAQDGRDFCSDACKHADPAAACPCGHPGCA